MKPTSLRPQCGEFTIRGRGTIRGVMLMANVPEPNGQWWVGGRPVVLVQWADGRTDLQPTLYRRVNRIVRAAKTEGEVLKALATRNEFVLDYTTRGRA